MYYDFCPDCGAALDPGESCDCKKNAGIAPPSDTRSEIAEQSALSRPSDVIIEDSLPNVKPLILVQQLPIIEEHLRDFKATVDASVNEAMSLVCTADSLQAVKSARADLNKKFAELEEQRKAVKRAVLAPYEQFETV